MEPGARGAQVNRQLVTMLIDTSAMRLVARRELASTSAETIWTRLAVFMSILCVTDHAWSSAKLCFVTNSYNMEIKHLRLGA